jgi:GT2 family glycosyltransferase
MRSTPVAVFTYNRPAHTRQMLESLAACHRLEDCRVFVFSDGPKTPDQEQAVRETRAVVHDWTRQHPADIVERNENRGLARSIVGGVSELCNRNGRVIVLEDDMMVGPRFLDYMLLALDRYQDDERVCQISGYMFPVRHPSQPDAFFLPLTTTWGWATWQRAWRLFQWDVSSALPVLRDAAVRRAFDLDGAYPYSAMLEDCIAQRNDSWGIRWWWSAFVSQKLTLHPRQSLVWVGGFDGTGTHAGRNQHMMSISQSQMASFPWSETLIFPAAVHADRAAMQRIEQYLRSRNKESAGRKLKKIKIRILSLLKRKDQNS